MEQNNFMQPIGSQVQQTYVDQYVPLPYELYMRKGQQMDQMYQKGLEQADEANKLNLQGISQAEAFGANYDFLDEQIAKKVKDEYKGKIKEIIQPFESANGSIDYGKVALTNKLKNLGSQWKQDPRVLAIQERKQGLDKLLEEKKKVGEGDSYRANEIDRKIQSIANAPTDSLSSYLFNQAGGTRAFEQTEALKQRDIHEDMDKFVKGIDHLDIGSYAKPTGDGYIKTLSGKYIGKDKIKSTLDGWLENNPSVNQHLREQAVREVASQFQGDRGKIESAIKDEGLINKLVEDKKVDMLNTMVAKYSMSEKHVGLTGDPMFEYARKASGTSAEDNVVFGNVLAGQQRNIKNDIKNVSDYNNSIKENQAGIANTEKQIQDYLSINSRNPDREIMVQGLRTRVKDLRNEQRYLEGIKKEATQTIDPTVRELYDKLPNKEKVDYNQFKDYVLHGPQRATGRTQSEAQVQASYPLATFVGQNGPTVQRLRGTYNDALQQSFNRVGAEGSTVMQLDLTKGTNGKNYSPIVDKINTYLTTPNRVEGKVIDQATGELSPNGYADYLNQGFQVQKTASLRNIGGDLEIEVDLIKPGYTVDGEKVEPEYKTITLLPSEANQASLQKELGQLGEEMVRRGRGMGTRYSAEDLNKQESWSQKLLNRGTSKDLSRFNEKIQANGEYTTTKSRSGNEVKFQKLTDPTDAVGEWYRVYYPEGRKGPNGQRWVDVDSQEKFHNLLTSKEFN